MSYVVHKGLEDALSSKEPIVALTARGTSSTWVEEFQKWVNDEVNGRGSSRLDMILAIIDIQIMLHSSLVTNFVGPGAFGAIVELYKERIEQKYVNHATEVLVRRKEMQI